MDVPHGSDLVGLSGNAMTKRILTEVLVQQADVATRNGRLYPRAVLQEIADNATRHGIPYLGMLMPPMEALKTGFISYASASHSAQNFQMLDDKLVCDIEISDTFYGELLLDLISKNLTPDFVLFGEHKTTGQDPGIVHNYYLRGIHAVKERA